MSTTIEERVAILEKELMRLKHIIQPTPATGAHCGLSSPLG